MTGLPVSQYQDQAAQNRLIERLTGTHRINGDTAVEVARVTVMPQPAGAYMDYINHTHDLDAVAQGRILIIDIGFYSVDWVTIEAGEIRMVSSGSSCPGSLTTDGVSRPGAQRALHRRRRRQGAITKCGNTQARRMLVESNHINVLLGNSDGIHS